MTDIAPARNIIQEEETKFRAGMSEGTFNRIGAANNYLMNRIYREIEFTAKDFIDSGASYNEAIPLERMFLDGTIVAYFLTCRNTGEAGDNTFNVSVRDKDGVTVGDVFASGSGRPRINGTAKTDVFVGRDVENEVDILTNTAGVAFDKGTLNLLTLSKGDILKLNINEATFNARTFKLTIVIRHD